jgi:AcrR family transcriptional regulator
MDEPVPTDPAAAIETPIRGRILGAAFRAFTENGYAGTSTLDIATRAKVSKRDLYANFAGKQEMLVACIRSRAERTWLPADLPPPRDRAMLAATLSRFGATVIREIGEARVIAMFRLAIAEVERSPEVARILQQHRLAGRAALALVLAQAQATGILGRGEPLQMTEEFYALLWGDLMMGLLLRAAAPPTETDIAARAHAATEAFLALHPALADRAKPYKGGKAQAG